MSQRSSSALPRARAKVRTLAIALALGAALFAPAGASANNLVTPYDFGSVVIGDQVSQTFSGTTLVTDPAETITSISWPIAGSNYPTDDLGVFPIDANTSTCAPGVTIQPGSGCTLVVDAYSRWPETATN